MKTFAFALLALALSLPLRADNLLQNGDFADGITHWHGECRSPADFAGDNPMAKPDPFTSKGMIIPLRPSSWVKVSQDFKGKISSGILTVTYMISPDFAFSTKAEDYVNVPGQINFTDWKPFNLDPGEWMAFITDLNTAHGTYYKPQPKLGSSDPQTFTAKVKGLTPLEDKTVTLAFPPGTGMIVLLSVSLTTTAD